jgi:hypothetical protein
MGWRLEFPSQDERPAGCPVCGCRDYGEQERIRDWRLGTPGEYTLRYCRHCGLAWIADPETAPPLPAVELSRAPARAGWRRWLKQAALFTCKGYPAPAPTWLARWLGMLVGRPFAGRLSLLPPYVPGGRLLDVGCGAGQYVRAMRELGWRAFGLEPALTPSSAGAPDDGAFAAGRAEQMPFASAQFDVITFWHSLEHTLSPHTALAEASRLLRPAGRLLLEVPNLDSLQARVFGRWWVHLDVPRHRCDFTPAALRRLLQDTGYMDVILRSRSSAVGWEGSVRNWASAHGFRLRGVGPLLRLLAHLAAGLEQMWGAGGGLWASARPAPAPVVLGGAGPSAPPQLSVIIVTWNCRPALERCLESLRPALAGLSAEIIAADNGSVDGTVEWLGRQAPDVRVLAFPENLGYAAAANRAAQLARGEYLWFLNPDTAVEPDAVTMLLNAMADHPRAGAAGPRLLTPDGRTYPLSARRFPTFWTELLEKAGLRGLSFSRLALMLGDETAEAPAVSGAAMCVRRPAWEEVGGFDERYFLYAEDMDICQALRAAGWKVYYVGQARVIHLGGRSSARCPEEAGVQALVSLLRYFRKQHGRLAGHAYRWMITLLSLMKMAIMGPAGLFVPAARAKAALQWRVLQRVWQESMIG